jgi:hypothetical protein
MSEEDQAVTEEATKKLQKRQARYKLQCQVLDDNLLISGQSRDHWEKKFKLFIPADALNPQLCIEFDTQLLALHQEATFLFNAAQARAQYLAHDSRDEYNKKIKGLVEDYRAADKRLPAMTTLDSLANIENMDEEYNAVAAEMESKFWKGILDHLNTCRRIIENVSLNISVEMKNEAAMNRAQYTSREN